MMKVLRKPQLTLIALLASVFVVPSTPQAESAPTLAQCAQTVGTPANLTVTVTGNDCVLTFTGDTTWTIPAGLTSARFLLVGGGGGGSGDGGGGGGGGGALYHSNVSLTPGVVANIDQGAGGASNSSGAPTRIDLNGDSSYEWSAGGGSTGGGWSNADGGTGGQVANQSGATAYTGGRGGDGPTPLNRNSTGANPGTNATNLSLGNGNQFDITGSSLWYGGGGGGGVAAQASGSPTGNFDGGTGGNGGGGRGAAQRSRGTTVSYQYSLSGTASGSSISQTANCAGNTGYPGATKGFPGLNGYGGGGGAGASYGDGCAGSPSDDDGERTAGGTGGSGVVIIRYTPDITAPITSIAIAANYLTSGTSVSTVLSINEALSSVTLYYSTSLSLTSPTSCGTTSNPTNGQTLTCAIAPSDGTYYIYSRGTDSAGNVESAPISADDSIIRDTTAPTRSSATLLAAGNQIQLLYSETLSTTAPNAARFRVSDSGTVLTPTAASFADSRTITLFLSSTIAKARTVTITYETSTATGGALIEDLALNDAAPFTNISVTNSSSVLNVLPTPTSLTAFNVDTSSANFSFSSSPNTFEGRHKLLIYESTTSTLVYGAANDFFCCSKVTGLTPATRYFVTVRSIGDGITYESSTTSAPIYFTTLIRKPVISSEPSSLSRTAGQSASFSVTATSPDAGILSYQWQKNSVNISGETSSTLSFASTSTSDAATYRVIVTNVKNGVSDSVTSSTVSLTVASALEITTPLSGLTAVVDSAYTLSLTTSGGSGTKTFSTFSGSLPTGLTLAPSTGVISGTPRSAGSNSLSIRVTDNNSATATTSSFTITVNAANQTITFGALSDRAFGSGSFTLPLTDTSTSGLAITFASTTPSICTLSGSDSRTVNLLAAGTCTITADQAGDSNYLAASQVTRSFTISKATTSLSSFSVPSKTFGNAPFTLTAPTVTGSLPGTLTYSSSNTLIATISDSAVTIVKAGSVTITALFTPTDSSNYETSTITATLTIDKASQTSLLISSPTTIAFGQSLNLQTSGGEGTGTVTYLVLSSTPANLCSISGSSLTSTGVGSCTITATKASDDNYLAETSSVTTITITTGSATATISFTSATFTFGITNPITVTTSVAGVVRFSANGKLIKNCKARATTLTGPFTATCSYRPDTRRPLTITAILTPTDTRFATRTSTSGTFFVARRTGTRS